MQNLSQAIASGDLNAALHAPTVAEANKPALSSIAERGKADGEAMQGANREYGSKLAQFAHQTLCSAAEMLKGRENDTREYLSGYRLAFDDKSAKVRASEARAFFDAFVKDETKVRALVQADTDGRVYHELIAECRKIRGKRIETKERQPKLTEKGAEVMAEKIAIATLPQAESVAHQAVKQIIATAKKDWENAIVKQIDALAAELSRSEQPIYQIFAEELLTHCAEIIVHSTGPEKQENRSPVESAEAKAA